MKTSCHTRLIKPNVFILSIRIWLLVFLLQPVIINTLQKHCKNEAKKVTPLLYVYDRLDYSAFFLNVIFLQWGGGTLGTYIIALVDY